MSQRVKLLLDEHIWYGLMDALVQQGFDVVHVISLGERGLDDEPLLALAASQGRAVLTNNMADFVTLVEQWHLAGREHAGVILTVRQPPGDLLRQTVKLLETLNAEELRNTCRWLQEFKG